jgi:xylulokinase
VQEVPATTIGASFGAAFLAATATAEGEPPSIADWNPVAESIRPDEALRDAYDRQFRRFVRLYADTAGIVHELAAEQRGADA